MSTKQKQKRSKGRSSAPNQAISDPRFANFQTDAVYRLPSKKDTHVSVDPRFAHMLQDKSFTSRAKVDRYGRALSQGKDRNLERLYKVEKSKPTRKQPVESDDEEEDEEDKEEEEEEEEDDDEDEDEDEDGGVSLAADEDVEEELARVGGALDPARTGGFAESSSEEDTSDESDLEDEEEEESGLAARQVEDVPEGEVSSRLAAVNLDWDNIRAVDLMVVLQSFAPKGEKIKKVTIYPSEFGRERMEREEVEGPPKELFQRKVTKSKQDDFGGFSDDDEEVASDQESEDEDERIKKSLLQEDQGDDFDPVQLRKYQLERLRYYYAVIDCSSSKCAVELYRSVDNTEYLSTANFFDLRFVPDDTDFSEDKPRDSCHRIPEDYAPNDFSTDALRNSNVKLTWDADDTNRKETQRRAFSRAEIDENDIKAYLASDSSDDENGVGPEVVDATLEDGQGEEVADSAPKFSKKEAERVRMRAALGLGAEKTSRKSKDEPMGDMEITFSSALGTGGGSVFENEPIPDEMPLDKLKRKERERKLRRKENRKARLAGGGEKTGEQDAGRQDQPDLGFDDPFFTAPENDQKAAQAARKEEKRRKRAERDAKEAQTVEQKAELEKILGDGQDALDAGIAHFDISALQKAEKAARRKGKKGKLRASEKQALEAKAKDTFEMDVEDPRFKAVFEDPSLALDPNNKRFIKTEGTQKMLEAGRKKRARDMDGEADDPLPEKRKRSLASTQDDLSRLVQRVKGSAK